MKVYAISDLHLSINSPKPMDVFGGAWEDYLTAIDLSWSEKVEDGDVVLIAGDISWAMNLEQAVPDLQYIGRRKGKKVILRGNHDYWWKSIAAVRSALPEGMYAVQNDCIRLSKLLVCGSRGWTTPESPSKQSPEDKKIYDRELVRLQLSLDSMKKQRKEDDKVAVMLHFPPFNSRFEPTPFTSLIARYAPDAVVYGHLHGKNSRICKSVNIEGVTYTLSSCDLVDNKLVDLL